MVGNRCHLHSFHDTPDYFNRGLIGIGMNATRSKKLFI